MGKTNQNQFLGELKLSSLLTLALSVLLSASLLPSILSLSLSLSSSFHGTTGNVTLSEDNQSLKQFSSTSQVQLYTSDVFPPSLMGRGSRIHGSFQNQGQPQGRKVNSTASRVHLVLYTDNSRRKYPWQASLHRVRPVLSLCACTCMCV